MIQYQETEHLCSVHVLCTLRNLFAQILILKERGIHVFACVWEGNIASTSKC